MHVVVTDSRAGPGGNKSSHPLLSGFWFCVKAGARMMTIVAINSSALRMDSLGMRRSIRFLVFRNPTERGMRNEKLLQTFFCRMSATESFGYHANSAPWPEI